jgi:hypothetical protein
MDTQNPNERPINYTVKGTIASTTGAPVPGVQALAYDRRITGDVLLGQAPTDANGNYSISYSPKVLEGKAKPDIEVRVVAGREGGPANNILGTSETRYNAGSAEIIDVIVKAAGVPRGSEYERLVTDLRPHMGNIPLKDLQENEKNSHITLLSNKTGWDARVVAMTAQANKLEAANNIPAQHFYALFRAGLPADNEVLSRLSSSTVENILIQAIKEKVIPAGDIQATLKAFGAQSVNYLLRNSAPVGVSTLGAMLAIRLNADEQHIFAESYRDAGGNSTLLWETLKKRGVAQDRINKLQFDGKMGYLTFQNAPLVKRLYESLKVNDPLDLVKQGLYKAEEWKKVIKNDVPEGITADNYAASMANLLTLSYPNAVAAEMVLNNELKLGANIPKDEVYTFLNTNKQEDMLGVKPVKRWANYTNLKTETKAAVKQTERLFQLSPSNAAMSALADQGLSSAYEIVQYSRAQFMAKFAGKFPNATEASLTYTRAQEIFSSTTNVANAYFSYRTTPNIYALTGKLEKTAGDIIDYPTLEGLFGNMDYCSCDECKSVLGAAAYIVDLLHFIDLTDKPHDLKNPLEVLLERRPDIQHMQLTCENTNTVLPYIDIVNEILEFYIANGSLTGFTGHDIAEGTDTNDLLADPQYVITTAYDKTNTEVYPFGLPFDKARETLRQYFKAWDTTLEEVLLNFGSELSARKEKLGLNLKEYDILTNSGFRALPEYFGEVAATNIDALNAAIAGGKVFTIRTGITAWDLVNLLKTQFINPGTVVVPLLNALQVGADKIQAWYDGTLTANDLNNLLPATLDKSRYGANVGQWLTDNKVLISTLVVLTDMTPETDDCNLADMELRYLLPPDATKNRLTEITYHKFHRFIRLWKKMGWSMETTDKVITALSPVKSIDLTTANIDAAFVTLLARLTNFSRLIDMLSLSEKKIAALLPLWDSTGDLVARQTLCAQQFKMPLQDLLDLSKIAGLDPLATDLESDSPAMLQLLYVVRSLKEVPLKAVDLAYLLMNKDASNKLTPNPQTLLKHIKSLRDAIGTVEKENSVAPDNADLSFAKSKMTLVYDAFVVDTLFSLLTNSILYSSALNLPEESLPATLAANPQVGYDAFKKQLTYTGILSTAVQTDLNNKADALTLADVTEITVQADLDTFKTNFKQAVNNMKAASDADIAALAAGYPELKTVYDIVLAQPTPAKQTTALINNILPALLEKLKVVALQQTLVSITKADPDVITVLTGSASVIKSISDNTKNVLNDFAGLETTVTFNANQSYDGYLDPLASDDYILFVKAPANTTVTLTINGTIVINGVMIGAPGETQSALPLTLTAGTPAPVQLTLAGLAAAKTAELWWRTKGMAKSQVPAANFYIKSNVDNAVTSLIRIMNAGRLQQLLKLTAAELAYFAAVNAETKDFLNDLPANNAISDPNLISLWKKVYLLVFFTLLKKETEQDENSWLQILQQPTLTTPQGKILLLDMNNWLQSDVDAVLVKLGKTWNDISVLSTLKKVVRAMQLVTGINFPAASVISWSIDNPNEALINTIKAAIRDRTDDAAWLDTMQSISDVMRNLQRDALVSYILHHQQPLPQVDTADKLYEFFLIDVQMDACMLTSRIVQATATIQLFIYRCLMNLELNVAPSSIKSNQWTWMQRYRVWQANRKLFLYPENWLDPQLRDGKSSFYQELEGELMQADITDELAETAYLNYLKKLDDVARLEITGIYLQENEQGNKNDDILHTFGRTMGHTRQYYYRRFEYGYWTPWEKVGLNLEGEHIFPIIWKSRLFVFWLNIIEKAKEGNRNESPTGMSTTGWGSRVKKDVEINMCWGEYYKGKWTSPKSSDLKDPVLLPDLEYFEAKSILLYARKEKKDPRASEHLIFYMVYPLPPFALKTITFTSKNSPPILGSFTLEDAMFPGVISFNYELFRKVYEGSDPSTLHATLLKMRSKQLQVLVDQPDLAAAPTVAETILTKSANLYTGFRLLPLRHITENQWQAPFVYHDERSVFVAQPEEINIPPLWIYQGFYDIGIYEKPDYKVKIPPMVEKPVIVKPPKRGIPDPAGPVVNPEPWQQVVTNFNDNYKTVLPTAGSFNFDQGNFRPGGKIPSLKDLVNAGNMNR